MFNIFNRTNFLSNQLNNTFNPGAVTFDTGDSSTATTITGFSGVPGNFGQSTATRDARQAQFGVKLSSREPFALRANAPGLRARGVLFLRTRRVAAC